MNGHLIDCNFEDGTLPAGQTDITQVYEVFLCLMCLALVY